MSAPTADAGGRPQTALELMLDVVAAAPRLSGARSWWVVEADEGVELRMPAALGRSTTAPGVREARICAGAALLGMRLVVAVQGWRPHVVLQPDPTRPEVLALLHAGEPEPPRPQDRALHALIGAAPLPREPPAPAALRYALRRAAALEDVWLRTATGRAALAGIDVPDTVRERLPEDGFYVVLGGEAGVPAAHVRVGQALHRVVLTAAALGLQASALAGPRDVHAQAVPARANRPIVLLAVTPPVAGAARRRGRRPQRGIPGAGEQPPRPVISER